MLTLISPAKSLDFASPLPPDDPGSEPRFPVQTARLVSAAARLNRQRFAAMMPVSPALVALNRERFRGFDDQPGRPAIRAFAGDVYRGFEAATLDGPALAFAQDHLRILSGLYGLLRPFDAIRPHRLEMGTRWAPRHASLLAFWGDRIARAVAADLEGHDRRLVLNLASMEYAAAVLPHARRLAAPLVTVEFRQREADGPRVSSFEAKRARGLMARWICEHAHDDPAALPGFDLDGWRIARDAPALLVFVRP